MGLAAIAKIVVGAMLGLAALAVVSLLLVAHRVHRRGRVGGKASATLRSLHAFVLGAGGWLAAALIVLTTDARRAARRRAARRARGGVIAPTGVGAAIVASVEAGSGLPTRRCDAPGPSVGGMHSTRRKEIP